MFAQPLADNTPSKTVNKPFEVKNLAMYSHQCGSAFAYVMVNCGQKFIILSYTIYSAGQHITLHGSKEELQQEETRESTGLQGPLGRQKVLYHIKVTLGKA